MASIFDETTINGMTLKNRMVRSATWEGMCEPNGKPTQKLIEHYRNLAKGNIGLIISGYTYVSPEGAQAPGMMGLYNDDFATEMEALVRAVHDEGGKIAIQLVHIGGQSPPSDNGPIAPSAIEAPIYKAIPKEMTLADIATVAQAFADAARRAKSYGFDGVQLHGAHGFLINQFLSPLTNKRTDDYGGTVEDRCTFLMDVYKKVREAVGDDYPVMIKLGVKDFLDGGLEVGDAVYAARKLSMHDIDVIEVSAGTGASGDKSAARTKINEPKDEAYNLDLARKLEEAISCPLMVVGGFRSYEVVEKAIDRRGMDYIAMSRPFIREPGLVRRWEEGDKSKAKCISCNGCFKPGMQEGGIYCVVEAKFREKDS
ncbi:NADH:flavin oxidoreductase [bacterium]|nr:NADH:flavin oxidoreductase [bacterium]